MRNHPSSPNHPHRGETPTMTREHTPGPWHFSFESADPNWSIVMDRSGGIVANVNSETGPDAASAPATRKMPATATARLIAAAPDMLAALRRIDSICAPGESDPDRMAEMLAEIAAIAERAAKATA